MKLYTKDNRKEFKVTKLQLLTLDNDETEIIICYADEDNQELEELVLRNREDKHRAKDILRELNTELMANARTDRPFWELWDYYKKHNQV